MLLVLLLVGKLQGTQAAKEPMVLLNVAEVVRQASDHILAMRTSSVHLDVLLMSSDGMFLQFGLASKLQVAVRDRTGEPVVAKYVRPEIAQRADFLTTHLTRLVHFDVEAVGRKCMLLQLLLACKLELAVGHLADPSVLLANVTIVVCQTSLNCTTLAAGLVHPVVQHKIKLK